MEGSAPTVDELLAHDAWLRRLVRRLVDDHEVDDVIQDTWTAALACRNGASGTRGWLVAVARNLALRVRRGHARRRRREAAVARHDELPSTERMLERLEAQRQVAQAVAELEEPFRTTLLLRFVHDMPPADIAAHLGVEPSTVRSRLQRGLARLRGRLEREGRDMPALAALLALDPRAHGLALGGVVGTGRRALLGGTTVMTMTMLTKSAGAVGLLALATLAARELLAPGPAAPPTAADGTASGQAVAALPQRELDERAPSRAALAAAGAAPEAAASDSRIRGRVLDRSGRAVPGVELVYEQRDGSRITLVDAHSGAVEDEAPLVATTPLGASGIDGAFDLSAPSAPGQLRPTESWCLIRAFTPAVAERGSQQALLVVAPRVALSGRVLDGDGWPIEGALLVPRVDGLLEFPEPLDRAAGIAMPHAVSDGRGAFTLDRLPGIPELHVECSHPDHANARVSGIAEGGLHDIVLQKRPDDGFRLCGTVVDTNGRLVPDAYVALGRAIVRTDRYGAFEVTSRWLHEQSAVVAGKPGLRASVDRELAQSLREGARDVGGVVLTIGPPTRSVTGRVVDPDGAAVPGLCLTVLDGTPIEGFWTAEDVARGIEPEVTSEAGTPMKVDARSDADGRFRIAGLDARPYRVHVYAPKTLVAQTVSIGPEAEVEIRFDPDARFERVRGVVRDRRGAVIRGAAVRVQLTTWDGGGTSLTAGGAHTVTGDDGAFALSGVPRGTAHLKVSGPGLDDTEVALVEPLADPLVLVVARRHAFRVALPGTDADAFVVVDEDGARVPIRQIRGQIEVSPEQWELRDGRSPVLHVSELARELVLLRDGIEVGRRTLALEPERVTVIE